MSTVEDAIAVTIAVIRESGWYSGTQARLEERVGEETWRAVEPKLNDPDTQIDADDRVVAQDVIEWVRSMTPDSDYTSNLQAAMGEPEMPPGSLPLVASSVAVYRRHADQLAGNTSKHFGLVGERWAGVAQLLSKRTISSERTTHLHKFLTVDGDMLVYWGDYPIALNIGLHAEIECVIKAHGAYNDVLETTVRHLTLK